MERRHLPPVIRQPLPALPARRARGFSLIELLVVFGIIALLTSMLMAGYISMQQNHRLTALTGRMISELQLARSMAIGNGRVYSFQLRPFTHQQSYYSFWVQVGLYNDADPYKIGQMQEVVPIDSRFTVRGAGPIYPPLEITFNPDGSAGMTAQIDILEEDQGKKVNVISKNKRTVEIFQGGMIRLKKAN